MSDGSSRVRRQSRRARAVVCVATVSVAAVVAATGSSASAHGTAHASAKLLPATVHPPTFNNTKLIGIRDALFKAMKGKSLKQRQHLDGREHPRDVLGGRQGRQLCGGEGARSRGSLRGPVQGQLTTQVSMYNTLAANGANGLFTSVIDPISEGATINKPGQGDERCRDRLSGSGQERQDVHLYRHAELHRR